MKQVFNRQRINQFLIILMWLFFAMCSKKDISITGIYTATRMFDGNSYEVELALDATGRLHWTPVRPIPGYEAFEISYVILDDLQVKLFDDANCGTEATYLFSKKGNELTFLADRETCVNRMNALGGTWREVD